MKRGHKVFLSFYAEQVFAQNGGLLGREVYVESCKFTGWMLFDLLDVLKVNNKDTNVDDVSWCRSGVLINYDIQNINQCINLVFSNFK